MPNSNKVIFLAMLMSNVNKAVEKDDRARAARINNTLHRNTETSMYNTNNANIIARKFDQIKQHYSRKFNSYGSTYVIRISAIFREIKRTILDYILADNNEPLATRNWVRTNKEILINGTAINYNAVLQESRNYLKSTVSMAQIAWRNFDPGSPVHARDNCLIVYDNIGMNDWKNLFVGDDAMFEVQEKLAYYYLAVIDNTQIEEQDRESAKINFIGQLADIRRAHNIQYPLHRDCKDSPSCLPGILSRLANTGNYNKIAKLSLDVEKQLSMCVNAKVAEKLGRDSSLFNTLNKDAKKRYYESISNMSIASSDLDDVINSTEDGVFSDELFELRSIILNIIGIDIYMLCSLAHCNIGIRDINQEGWFYVVKPEVMDDILIAFKTALGIGTIDYWQLSEEEIKLKIQQMLLDPYTYCNDIINKKFGEKGEYAEHVEPRVAPPVRLQEVTNILLGYQEGQRRLELEAVVQQPITRSDIANMTAAQRIALLRRR